jgi:predicted AAA+ superfamily ATPase
MRPILRKLRHIVREAALTFPSIVLTGPRRAGKTTILRGLFPKSAYVLLEDPDILHRVRTDPRGFLDELTTPVILDEIQNAPELFDYIRTRIDAHPQRMGQWLFTGSQEAPLMQGVSESMAGRAAILQMLPLSFAETPKVNLLHGGFPEVLARPSTRALWFNSYLQTYLERDVRSVANIRNLATFRRFLSLLASRHGQILNKTDLAAPLGVSVPTITEWLQILEITGQIILVSPFYENFGKRLIKSPKVYWGDSGLACHLLGITTNKELERSPFLGPVYEGFIASEILKAQLNYGMRKELYFFRDQQGLEVDFLMQWGAGETWMIECKAGRTVYPSMAAPLISLRKAIRNRSTVNMVVVHRPPLGPSVTKAVAPGVIAESTEDFITSIQPPVLRRGRPAKHH